MVGLSTAVKSPASADDPDEEIADLDGHLTHSEFASWIGNAIFLVSIGTIALVVTPQSRQLTMLSDALISVGLAVAVWASYKFFFLPRKISHHWTEWILFVLLVAVIAFFIWLAIIV